MNISITAFIPVEYFRFQPDPLQIKQIISMLLSTKRSDIHKIIPQISQPLDFTLIIKLQIEHSQHQRCSFARTRLLHFGQ
jgi:hypothetical protein